MPHKVKSQHAFNWFYGNICTCKCYYDLCKQKKCYQKMQAIIKGREDFLITHKIFIQVMRHKYKVCDLDEATFKKREHNFWHRKL